MKRPGCVCALEILAVLWITAQLPRAVVWLPAAIFIVFGLGFLWRKKKWPAACTLLAGIAAIGLLLSGGPHAEQALVGRAVAVRGWVKYANASFGGEQMRAVIQVEALDGKAASFRLLCPELPVCEVGTEVTLTAVMQPVPHTASQRQSYADGVFVQTEEADDVAFGPVRQNLWRRLYLLRRRWSRAIRLRLSRDVGGVLAAMCLGDRGHLLPQLYQAFVRAGIPHVLVVSGLHLHILCGLVPLSMKSAVSRRWYGIGSILLALFWVGLTGAQPSVERAAVSVCIHSLGVLLGYPADPVTSLALSGVVLSVGNPWAVCDVAFQLSFCAAAGVLLGAALCRKPDLPEKESLPRRARRLLREQLFVSGMAALLVLPIQMQWGMYISPVSVPANLAAFLLLRPLVCSGILAAVCSEIPALQFVVDGALFVGGCLARLLNAIAVGFAALPVPHFAAETRYPILVWLVLALFAGICYHKKYKPRWIALGCCGIACAAALAGYLVTRDMVRVTLLGTARSPSVVVTQRDEALILYRGGVANTQKIRKYLEDRNITRIVQVVDLRQNPSGPCPLRGERDFALRDLGEGPPLVAPMLPDVTVGAVRDAYGGAVALRCGDWVLWVNSGRLTAPIARRPNSFLLASAADPGDLKACENILSLSSRYPWLAEADTRPLCGSGRLTLWLWPPHTIGDGTFRLIGVTK